MKRLALTLVLCCATFMSVAQQKIYYCEVKGIEKAMSSGLKIVFDFGENASNTMWGTLSDNLQFVDEKGNEIKFNSMVDAANYMVDRGWEFKQAYSSTYANSPVIHWIFCKKSRLAGESERRDSHQKGLQGKTLTGS